MKALGQLGQQMPVMVQQALLAFLQSEHGDSSDVIYALGKLGEKMSAEVSQALIAEFKKPPGYGYGHIAAASVLVRLGQVPPEVYQALLVLMQRGGIGSENEIAESILEKLGEIIPPDVQQKLLAVLLADDSQVSIHLACWALDVVGITEVSWPRFTDALAATHTRFASRYGVHSLRCHLYVWSGRHPALLQAVRWFGNQTAEPSLDDIPPSEPLRLIARLWPHSVRHEELRQELAQRTTQIITTRLKTFPLDDATQAALQTLAPNLLEDKHPGSILALQHVNAALAADKKAR